MTTPRKYLKWISSDKSLYDVDALDVKWLETAHKTGVCKGGVE